MSLRRTIAQKFPLLASIYIAAMQPLVRFRMRRQKPEEVFSGIAARNSWSGKESVSGSGSDPEQTRIIEAEIPRLLAELDAGTILDVPCGDFHWMKNVPLSGRRYIGGDIVEPVVRQNAARHASANVSFVKMDLIRDPLPTADVVLCRDCLVHLSFNDALAALRNICASGSRYLLTTTFTDRAGNSDILTGEWRPLNLRQAPFSLAEPILVINEGCTEGNGQYADKSLALWRVSDIAQSISPRSGMSSSRVRERAG